MDQHLRKYLVLHKHLCIPQLGSFVIEQEPARFDQTNGTLEAPKPVTRFSEGQVPMSEKLFFDFLANETGVDELTAIKQFHDYSYRLRENLAENRIVEMKGVGILTKEDGAIRFESSMHTDYLLPALDMGDETIIVTEEEIVEKDNWWFYALILFILGSGALIYAYL